ncbi:unnamed protein product, partial [Polarella glacialis]
MALTLVSSPFAVLVRSNFVSTPAKMPHAQDIYPGPMMVRNTFIDTPVGRPDSLEGFLQERLAWSCPASRVSEPFGSGASYSPGAQLLKTANLAGGAAEVDALSRAFARSSLRLAELDAFSECSTADTGRWTSPATPEQDFARLALPPQLPLPPPPPSFLGCRAALGMPVSAVASSSCAPQNTWPMLGHAVPPPPPAAPAPYVSANKIPTNEPASPPPKNWANDMALGGSTPKILSLEEALGPAGAEQSPEDELLPSAGSAGHGLGQCRPCAFFPTKGCASAE